MSRTARAGAAVALLAGLLDGCYLPASATAECGLHGDHLICFDPELDWNAASLDCRARGRQLATLESEEEAGALAAALVAEIGDTHDAAWIGLSRGAGQAAFGWVSGGESDWRNWAGEPPAGSAAASCVQVAVSPGGEWTGRPCTDALPYVCEPWVDVDGDGWDAASDCDDGDPDVSPGLIEDCEDGKDNDCDPTTTEEGGDADGDGVTPCEGDCDDQDPDSTWAQVDPDCDGVIDPPETEETRRRYTAVVNGVAHDFVLMPPGEFEMGCRVPDAGPPCDVDETPHPVVLTRPFWIAPYEMTEAQWASLVGTYPSYFPGCGEDCPVNRVSWFDTLFAANALSAVDGYEPCFDLSDCIDLEQTVGTGCVDGPAGNHCDGELWCDDVRLAGGVGSVYECEGYRLPTEAEWEYAGRGGEDTTYAGGEILGTLGWWDGNSGGEPHPVGTRTANAWGLSDMSGNLYERVYDRYWNSAYEELPSVDPVVETSDQIWNNRIIRGGSFHEPADESRLAHRRKENPEDRVMSSGFRLVRTAFPEPLAGAP